MRTVERGQLGIEKRAIPEHAFAGFGRRGAIGGVHRRKGRGGTRDVARPVGEFAAHLLESCLGQDAASAVEHFERCGMMAVFAQRDRLAERRQRRRGARRPGRIERPAKIARPAQAFQHADQPEQGVGIGRPSGEDPAILRLGVVEPAGVGERAGSRKPQRKVVRMPYGEVGKIARCCREIADCTARLCPQRQKFVAQRSRRWRVVEPGQRGHIAALMKQAGEADECRTEPRRGRDRPLEQGAGIARLARTRFDHPQELQQRRIGGRVGKPGLRDRPGRVHVSGAMRGDGSIKRGVHWGTATSNATVSRSPSWNGRVPCHIVDGNSTSRPGLCSIVRSGARSRPSCACGSPIVNQPASP